MGTFGSDNGDFTCTCTHTHGKGSGNVKPQNTSRSSYVYEHADVNNINTGRLRNCTLTFGSQPFFNVRYFPLMSLSLVSVKYTCCTKNTKPNEKISARSISVFALWTVCCRICKQSHIKHIEPLILNLFWKTLHSKIIQKGTTYLYCLTQKLRFAPNCVKYTAV